MKLPELSARPTARRNQERTMESYGRREPVSEPINLESVLADAWSQESTNPCVPHRQADTPLGTDSRRKERAGNEFARRKISRRLAGAVQDAHRGKQQTTQEAASEFASKPLRPKRPQRRGSSSHPPEWRSDRNLWEPLPNLRDDTEEWEVPLPPRGNSVEPIKSVVVNAHHAPKVEAAKHAKVKQIV